MLFTVVLSPRDQELVELLERELLRLASIVAVKPIFILKIKHLVHKSLKKE